MSYIGNERHWMQLIEVDWLGQYSKAWVAFNAWFRNNFRSQGKMTDRQIIEEIKNDEGGVCSKIENFLSGEGSNSESFQSDLAALHKSLSDVTVKSNGERVWLKEITDYYYVDSIQEKKNRMTYEIEIDTNQKKRIVTVKNASGQEILKQIVERKDEKALKQKGRKALPEEWFNGLSHTQRISLEGFLKTSSPIYNLLDFDNGYTKIGPFEFIRDKTLIARALIEILYQLRNALFHGEITPNSDVQRVYQSAYLILKQIIPGP